MDTPSGASWNYCAGSMGLKGLKQIPMRGTKVLLLTGLADGGNSPTSLVLPITVNEPQALANTEEH